MEADAGLVCWGVGGLQRQPDSPPPLPVCSHVSDIFDVVRITVFDEDKGDKAEFLGALVISLLDVRNWGQVL